MNWLDKTPTNLFNNIPQEILENYVSNKQQKIINEDLNIARIHIVNQLLTRHILSKHKLPIFVTNQKDLIRWLFCIYIIE